MSNQVQPDSLHLSRFFYLCPDLLAVSNHKGYYLRVNPAFAQTLGYSEKELCSKPFLEFVHPDDHQLTKSVVQKVRAGDEIKGFENRYQTKEGTYRWLQWRCQPNKNRTLIYSSARDVTEERKLQMELLKVHKNVRTQISQSLHENLGQQLTGISLIADNLANRIDGDSPVGSGEVRELAHLAQQADELVSDLTHKVMPVEVERFGLSPALERLADKTQQITGAVCTTHVTSPPSFDDHSKALHLYYIAQASIANSVEQGKASKVSVKVTTAPTHVQLECTDNGTSYSQQESSKELDIIKYRTRLIGGSLKTTTNRQGTGMTITCTVPRDQNW